MWDVSDLKSVCSDSEHLWVDFTRTQVSLPLVGAAAVTDR